MILYTMAHMMKHRLHLKSLSQIHHDPHGRADGISIMQRVARVDRQFTATFSVFPFLILATNFFLSSGYLIGQFEPTLERAKAIDRYQLVVLALSFLSVPIVLVSIIARRRQQLSKVRYSLIDCLHVQENKSQEDVNLIETILRSMEKDSVLRMTWIDWPLVTAYLGSLLSFSVLFTQLVPKDRN
jgi:hypothetical protein